MLENKEASNKSEGQNLSKEPGKPNTKTNRRIEEDEDEILLVEEEEQEEKEINAETVRNVFSQNKKNGYVKTSPVSASEKTEKEPFNCQQCNFKALNNHRLDEHYANAHRRKR